MCPKSTLIYKVNLQQNWVSLCKGVLAAALFPYQADLGRSNIATKKRQD
jgi:hypothetical protein